MCVQVQLACRRRLILQTEAGLLSFDRGFSFARERVVFSAVFFAMSVQAQLACWRGLAPWAGVGFFYLTEVFRLRESELFFCGVFRDVRADAACLLAQACPSGRGGPFLS